MEDGNQAFEKLKRTNAYSPFCEESLKRKMIVAFWEKSAAWLQDRFGPTGFDPYKNAGLGFVLEGLMEESEIIPSNTPEGELVSDFVLNAIATGDYTMGGAGFGRENPDKLLVRTTVTSITIYGMVEAKVSSVAVETGLDQLRKQERVLRDFARRIQRLKQEGFAPSFFSSRTIKVAGELQKILLVPAGEKEKVLAKIKILPEGWECAEVEVSYEEMVFLAKLLWPEFRARTKFKENKLAGFEKGFLALFLDIWARAKFRKFFCFDGDEAFPLRKIILFCCATGRVPLEESEIGQAAQIVEKLEYIFHLYPDTVISEEELLFWERTFLTRFMSLPDELLDMKGLKPEVLENQILLFLLRLREFKKTLLRQNGCTELLCGMRELDILKIPS